MLKILKNKDLYKFLPKNKFINYLFLSLGFFSSWPIYFDLQNLSLALIEFNINIIAIEYDGIPVPIGSFSFAIYIFLVMIRTKSIFFLIKSITLYSLIISPFLVGFDTVRIPVIIFPIIFIVILKRIVDKRYEPNDGFAIGYIFGLISFYFLNIISFLVFSAINQEFLNIDYTRQIFGYEIWQFYVSYSAISSLVFGTYTLYLINNYYVIGNFKIIFGLLSFASLVILILPYRRAAFFDITLINFIFLKEVISYLYFLKSSKKYLFSLLFTSIGLGIFSTFLLSNNYFDISERARIAKTGIDVILNENLFGLLFGFERGFGGFSNLFVEFIIRNGLVGLIGYLGVLFYCFNSFLKSLRNIPYLPNSKNMNIIFFIILSVLIGNIVNLNFGVPYYVINLGCIFVTIYSIDITSRIRNFS